MDIFFRNQKKLIFIPIGIVLVSLVITAMYYSETGEIIQKDVSLKGGVSATVHTEKTAETLEEYLEIELGIEDIIVRKLMEFGTNRQIGFTIEASPGKDIELREFGDRLREKISENINEELTDENFSIESTGSTLGESFYKQMMIAIGIAFILMAIVVFIAFRDFIPSFAVVMSAFSDMAVTIAVLNIIGMRLSTAGIAAILLLIGYSIDTDILLTTRILKRKEEGNIIERAKSSMKTGLTMTFTTVAAVTVGYFVSTSYILQQMFLIIIIGLIVDVIMTYGFNLGVLMWHVRRKEHG